MVHSKHSDISFKNVVFMCCGVREGHERESLCLLENDGQREVQDPFLPLTTPKHPQTQLHGSLSVGNPKCEAWSPLLYSIDDCFETR